MVEIYNILQGLPADCRDLGILGKHKVEKQIDKILNEA